MVPSVVTPNGDGRGDEAKIEYRLSAAASVTATRAGRARQHRRDAVHGAASGRHAELRPGTRRRCTTAGTGCSSLATAGSKQVQTSTRFWIDRTLAAYDGERACVLAER